MSDNSNTVSGLKQDVGKATEKVSDHAQKVADKTGDKAQDLNPESKPSILEQGQKWVQDTGNYVHEQASHLFNSGNKEGQAQQGGKDINESLGHLKDDARDYANKAMDTASKYLHQGGDKAGEAASNAQK